MPTTSLSPVRASIRADNFPSFRLIRSRWIWIRFGLAVADIDIRAGSKPIPRCVRNTGGTMRPTKIKLDPNRHSFEAQEFESAMRRRIVGQEDGVRAVADLYQVFRAGMSSTGRPVGNLLFLGPTGSGKTRIVEAAAEILFGDPRAVIKVDCAEFQHSHEIAKLIGSPPGYLGHRETHPLITQEALAQYHKEDLKLSFLLFDEIE